MRAGRDGRGWRRAGVLAAMLLALLAAGPPRQRRSTGSGGSLPVGLDGYTAFADLDCAKLNGDRRRSHERVPLPADCKLLIPSPDGSVALTVMPAGGEDDSIRLTVPGGLVVAGLTQPTVLLWNPASTGFLINDGEGSGQTSRLRYFYRDPTGWHKSRSLDRAAAALYRRRYDCRGGRDSYANVSGWDWASPGRLRIVIQEGVHSRGCLQPYEDSNVLFEVIGDPVTGRITSAREIDERALGAGG